MTNNEAKFILNAYRPNGADAGDAAFSEALEQAKRDPALGAWFAREQAHNAAVAAKLREVAAPAGLREAILAGARMGSDADGKRTTIWTRPTWMALAAGVAVLLAVSATLWSKRAVAELDPLATFALDDTAHAQHGSHGPDAKALQVLLSQPTTRLAQGLSVDVAELRATGCRTVRLNGHEVAEVCFVRNGTEFHFYVTRKADFPAIKSDGGAQFAQSGKLCCASWSDASHHFVVVSNAGMDAVKGLL